MNKIIYLFCLVKFIGACKTNKNKIYCSKFLNFIEQFDVRDYKIDSTHYYMSFECNGKVTELHKGEVKIGLDSVYCDDKEAYNSLYHYKKDTLQGVFIKIYGKLVDQTDNQPLYTLDEIIYDFSGYQYVMCQVRDTSRSHIFSKLPRKFYEKNLIGHKTLALLEIKYKNLWKQLN